MQKSDPTVTRFLDHLGRELVDQFSRDLTIPNRRSLDPDIIPTPTQRVNRCALSERQHLFILQMPGA